MKLCLILAGSLFLGACHKIPNLPPKDHANAGAPSDPARAALKALIEDVTTANGRKYDSKDNVGHNMDCAKIIANPSGGFIAVYHTYVNGEAKVNLASSTDLLNWTWIREL